MKFRLPFLPHTRHRRIKPCQPDRTIRVSHNKDCISNTRDDNNAAKYDCNAISSAQENSSPIHPSHTSSFRHRLPAERTIRVSHIQDCISNASDDYYGAKYHCNAISSAQEISSPIHPSKTPSLRHRLPVKHIVRSSQIHY